MSSTVHARRLFFCFPTLIFFCSRWFFLFVQINARTGSSFLFGMGWMFLFSCLNAFIVIEWYNEIVVQLQFKSVTGNKYCIACPQYNTYLQYWVWLLNFFWMNVWFPPGLWHWDLLEIFISIYLCFSRGSRRSKGIDWWVISQQLSTISKQFNGVQQRRRRRLLPELEGDPVCRWASLVKRPELWWLFQICLTELTMFALL